MIDTFCQCCCKQVARSSLLALASSPKITDLSDLIISIAKSNEETKLSWLYHPPEMLFYSNSSNYAVQEVHCLLV